VGGWIANDLAAIDFAGGTAVHINAGAAALALAIVSASARLAARAHAPAQPDPGHARRRPAVVRLVRASTPVALAPTAPPRSPSQHDPGDLCGDARWLVVERIRTAPDQPRAASGIVAGLSRSPRPAPRFAPRSVAIVVGAVAWASSARWPVGLKFRFGFDDSLDVVGVHLVGGLVGSCSFGFLATTDSPAGVAGLF
jgi:Amt family ammonium transporter